MRQLSELTDWDRLLKKILWSQLENIKEKKILDFGSGEGITANHFAKDNEVVAVEPWEDMLQNRWQDYDYLQIKGDISAIAEMQNNSFDVVFCHNVLEYVENRAEIIAEFHRLLKKGGVLSIVKHNKDGKIMHKAVFENNVEEALSLLAGEKAVSQNFGTIDEYETEELLEYMADRFTLEKVGGIRTFFGIQPNSFKSEPDWEDSMFELECAVEAKPIYANVAFFQHLIFRKSHA